MLGYIVRRLVAAFLVIVLTSMMVFALFFLGPTNPADAICNKNGRCTADRQANIEHELGLDQSVVTQYGEFVKGLFVDREIQMGATYHCDAPCLGISYTTQQEVRKEMVSKYPVTLAVAIGGSVIFLSVGVTLGALAARWRGTPADKSLVSGSLLLSAVPYYVICLLAWIYLVNEWGIFPDGQTYQPLTQNPAAWFGALLLPWLVLGIASSTDYARFTRGSMAEVLGEDYIRTATAKGLRTRTVVFRHALRAAIVPIVTIFGLDFAGLLSGTIFTEYIFDLDGVGNWSIDALSPVDFPVVSASVLVAAVLIVIANLVVDIVYSVIDPRVRLV
jgi:peptide/nickel transport system permease protein